MRFQRPLHLAINYYYQCYNLTNLCTNVVLTHNQHVCICMQLELHCLISLQNVRAHFAHSKNLSNIFIPHKKHYTSAIHRKYIKCMYLSNKVVPDGQDSDPMELNAIAATCPHSISYLCDKIKIILYLHEYTDSIQTRRVNYDAKRIFSFVIVQQFNLNINVTIINYQID